MKNEILTQKYLSEMRTTTDDCDEKSIIDAKIKVSQKAHPKVSKLAFNGKEVDSNTILTEDNSSSNKTQIKLACCS
jgi:hypothetical protein